MVDKVRKMHQAVLLIGGNLGDRVESIRRAQALLLDVGKITSRSLLYETQAWGGVSKGLFLNQALVLETPQSPSALLQATQKIENLLGRRREVHWGDRTMDIDIIYYDKLIYKDERLTIPHPMMAERNFVLVPLVEILPDFVHPVLRLNHKTLLSRCRDTSKVEPYAPKTT